MSTKSLSATNYSKSEINRAGADLVSNKVGTEKYDKALEVVNSWRASHAYPINTFVSTLRKKVRKISDPIVAQRLKRLPTIIDKLERYPEMNLVRMQDIGGVRGVVNTIEEVCDLTAQYEDTSRFTHELIRHDDYIKNPKPDGYRGVHLVYKYDNTLARNNKAEQYKGLIIELQLRTKLQHTWATAVETMGTFRNEALKSSKGSNEWLEFFALTSSSFAYLEKTPTLEKFSNLSLEKTFKRMKELDEKNRILEQIKGYSYAARVIHDRKIDGFYQLISLNTKEHTLTINPFKKDELDSASDAYEKLEANAARGEPIESVLVAVGRLKSLRQAYPNYFLDTRTFLEKIEVIYSELY